MVTLSRQLPDGAGYELKRLSVSGQPYLGFLLNDNDGDRSVVTLDREQLRRLITDLTEIGELQPTPSTIEPAAALLGAVRRNFELLRELEKTAPTAVDQIVAMMAAHLRSWRPLALLAVEAP